MNKKAWLDYLYYDVGKQHYDYFLGGLKLMPDGEIKSHKWQTYSETCFGLVVGDPENKLWWINQRQILPNELVLDIEIKLDIEELKRKLNLFGILNYSIFDSGSRGYHIHIFSKSEITETIKSFFCKMFGADIVKSGNKTMIALEYCPHWKTGKIKELVFKNG